MRGELIAGLDIGLGGPRAFGQGDIVAHRTVEQHVLLEHHADLPPQPGRVGHHQIHAVDQHAAALRHVEPLHQFCEGALARTRRADDADGLAGRNIEGDVVQDFRSVEAVAKRDVLEANVALERRQPGAARGKSRLRGTVENVTEPGDREPRLMKILP